MSEKILKRQHLLFIEQFIAHGDAVKAYQEAYPNCKSLGAARTNAHKLLKNAAINQAIKDHQKKVTEAVSQEVTETAKKKARSTVLSSMDKRNILAKIATGKLKVQDEVYVDGQKKKIMRKPNLYERLRAIHIDNLMTGDHITKQDMTTAGQPLQAAGDKTIFRLPDGTEIEI